jgi:hypothetical protein
MSIYTIKKKKNNTFSFATRLGWLATEYKLLLCLEGLFSGIKYCCTGMAEMPNVVSAIDGTSHEIQIPSNEPQQKTYFQQTNSFH